MVTANGEAKVASQNHAFPNGMAIVGNSLIVAESLIPGLTAFDLGADGVLTNRRPWVTLSKAPQSIVPDGICIDSEGAIWAANAWGCEALRIGEGGTILDRVETSQFAFSCALGGTDGRDLVIATAPDSNPRAVAGESRGTLQIARVGVAAMERCPQVSKRTAPPGRRA